MHLSTRTRNRAFWALQLLGWGFTNTISIFLLKGVSAGFLFVSILAGIAIGIFSTTLLREYLKTRITFEQFGIPEIVKILISFLLCSLLYAFLNIAVGYLIYTYFPSLNETDLQIFKIYDSFWLLTLNSLMMIFGWLICYLVIKLLLKLNTDRLERLELNSHLKQAQLNTLKGQINPHFMFNSLNNIRGLMLEDVEKAREMLTKLSEMLRYSLTQNTINTIPLEQELEMVDHYMDLSKIQFEDRLFFTKAINPLTRPKLIPPMVIQLLIENAVKHGISNLKHGGKIDLLTDLKEDQLIIEVRNSGRLLYKENTTRLGLKNIEERLKLLHGNKASFELEETDHTVVATIKIPLQ